MRKKNQSDRYQYIFKEFSVDNLEPYPNQLWQQEDLTLKEMTYELADLIIQLANKILTQKQLQIFTLLLSGNSQAQIADILGISQPTVCRSLLGWQNKTNKRRSGGIYHKLRQAIQTNKPILELKEEIEEYKRNRI